ncbi:hypothetical protein CFC21_037033 [Triticum aestivum]|uniref:Uncharacterized protein n=4 Tax=Triticum TaxID=4564 RepID=A0A9R0VPA9_TRITD|nr:uncharacterized protein LOC125545353 [Triticum urartu]KAF7024730.1 hypothetical protein CFC21_037033 [Triticum aestivum]VAH65945.1 unnamed protein product [Triticum turgidum subsp. durum]
MATPGDGEDAPPPPPVSAAGAGGSLIAKLREQWRSTKEHAETYPYVWGSYILVYGGLGAYITWRWCKLRRTEDRVRALQARLRQLAAAEESQGASAATPPPPLQQPPPPTTTGPGKPPSPP